MATSGGSPTLRDLLLSLTVGQAWAIGAALVALVVGAFVFGGVVESFNDRIELTQLSDKNTQLQQQNVALKTQFASALNQVGMVSGKAEFLNRYVQYLIDHDATSKKLFVDVVCMLWKQSENKVLHPGAPDFSTTEVTDPFATVQPFSTVRRFATVTKPAQEVKIVTFFDQTSYDMPQEIVIAVHADNRCSVLSQ